MQEYIDLSGGSVSQCENIEKIHNNVIGLINVKVSTVLIAQYVIKRIENRFISKRFFPISISQHTYSTEGSTNVLVLTIYSI